MVKVTAFIPCLIFLVIVEGNGARFFVSVRLSRRGVPDSSSETVSEEVNSVHFLICSFSFTESELFANNYGSNIYDEDVVDFEDQSRARVVRDYGGLGGPLAASNLGLPPTIGKQCNSAAEFL